MSFDDSIYVAPYTIQCLSINAEMLKISGIEFQKKCLKEVVTEDQFITNLRKKQAIVKFKETQTSIQHFNPKENVIK